MLESKWNYFATSHVKSACDRIGATVKRLLTKGSLQRPYTDPIPSSEAIMEFCTKYNPRIHFLPEDIAKHGMKLQRRYQVAETVTGTQQSHRLVPVSQHAYKLSLQSGPPNLVSVLNSEDEIESLEQPKGKVIYAVCITIKLGLG